MKSPQLWIQRPYRLLLFAVPFQTIALVTVAGFGLQLVQISLVAVCLGIVITAVYDSNIRLVKQPILVIVSFQLLLIVLYLWGYTTPETVPGLYPPQPDPAGQLLYWTAAVGYFSVSHIAATNTDSFDEIYRDWMWFVIGGLVAVGIAAYHSTSFYTGIPFPFEMIYSNPSFGINAQTRIAGVKRFTGPFPEPSMFSRFVAIAMVISWGLGKRAAVLIFAAALVMSLSTTGLIGLVIAGVLILIAEGRTSFARRVMAGTVVGFPIMMLIPTIRKAAWELTIGKIDSISVHQRSTQLIAGLTAWADRPILGGGLGVERTNDGLSQLLLNLGIIGVLPLLYLFGRALQVRISDQTNLVSGLKLALVTAIALHIVSGPDWTKPYVWVLSGYLWGLPVSDIYE